MPEDRITAPTFTSTFSAVWLKSMALFWHTPLQISHFCSLRKRQLFSSIYEIRGIAWEKYTWTALFFDISWLYWSGYTTGQYSTQVVQPVQLSSIMYLGFLIRVTLKSPASPSTLSTSVSVKTSIFGCRPTSTSLGESIHMEQSLVGKVLSSWAICPPMLGVFSTR